MDSSAFEKALLQYREACRAHLEQGRNLSRLLEDDEFRAMIEKPFLLKMVFEKYLDLLEDRLIPALRIQDEGTSKATAPAERSKPHKPAVEKPAPMPRPTEPPSSEPPVRRAVQLTLEAAPSLDDSNDQSSRRIIPRYARRFPIRYGVLGRDKTMQRAFSRDVGARGLFVASNRPEKVGSVLDMEIDMPEIGKVKIQATVAWTKWVPQSLRSVDCSGFGVRVSSATESWYRYFMDLEKSGAPTMD